MTPVSREFVPVRSFVVPLRTHSHHPLLTVRLYDVSLYLPHRGEECSHRTIGPDLISWEVEWETTGGQTDIINLLSIREVCCLVIVGERGSIDR